MPTAPGAPTTPVDLWRNENHHGPSPAVFAALHAITPDMLREYARSSPLTKHLAADLGVDPTAIALAQGAEDVLTQALQVLLTRGERVMIPSASWHYYRTLVHRVGGEITEYPVTPHGDDWTTDVDALIAAHRRRPARVILITTVSNPTGALFPFDRLEDVLKACADAVVIVDDAYGDFRDDLHPAALAMLVREYPHLMVVRTLSKLHALAGVRIGYGLFGAGTVGVADAMARSLGHNRIAEALAVAALNDVGFHTQVRKTIAADRDRLAEALSLWPQVTVYRSAANFQLIRFPDAVVDEVAAALAADNLIVKWWTGTAAVNEPAFAGCVRISVGTTDEHDRVREAIVGALRRRYGRPGARRAHGRCDLTDAYAMAPVPAPYVRRVPR